MSPHYYNGDEFAMNFEGRIVSFAKFLLRVLASQVRNVREFVKAKFTEWRLDELRRTDLLRRW
jgi:hypothetical protein